MKGQHTADWGFPWSSSSETFTWPQRGRWVQARPPASSPPARCSAVVWAQALLLLHTGCSPTELGKQVMRGGG